MWITIHPCMIYFSVHWVLLPVEACVALCTKNREKIKAVSDCCVIKHIVNFYQINHYFFLFTFPFLERENIFVSGVFASSVVFYLMRMVRSSDDIEKHLPSDTAILEPAGVLLWRKAGMEVAINTNSAPLILWLCLWAKQEPPTLTEMMGHEHVFPGFAASMLSAYLLHRTTHMLCISCVHACLCWWFKLAGVWRHQRSCAQWHAIKCTALTLWLSPRKTVSSEGHAEAANCAIWCLVPFPQCYWAVLGAAEWPEKFNACCHPEALCKDSSGDTTSFFLRWVSADKAVHVVGQFWHMLGYVLCF